MHHLPHEPSKLTTASFAGALGLGLAAALVGAALHWTVGALTGLEIGYVSLAIGFLVGAGVRRGAGRRSFGLQLLALALTYLSIALAYVPVLLKVMAEHGAGPLGMAQLASFAGLALSLPVRVGLKLPVNLVLTAIALFEAWKMTKPGALVVAAPRPAQPTPSHPTSRPRVAAAVAPPKASAAPARVVVPAPAASPPAPTPAEGGTLLERAARMIEAEQAMRRTVVAGPPAPRSDVARSYARSDPEMPARVKDSTSVP
jgi:hypothetical protein